MKKIIFDSRNLGYWNYTNSRSLSLKLVLGKKSFFHSMLGTEKNLNDLLIY